MGNACVLTYDFFNLTFNKGVTLDNIPLYSTCLLRLVAHTSPRESSILHSGKGGLRDHLFHSLDLGVEHVKDFLKFIEL